MGLYFLLSIIIMIILFALYPIFKKGLFIIGIFNSIFYILWRLTTIPYSGINLILGIVLFSSELLGLFQFLLFCYISSRPSKELPAQGEFHNSPTVDIVIPTYGEPIYILKETIAAALAIKYDSSKISIYVCDDGKRFEVKKLCDEFNINYSVRPDNTHAKSGNINNMLKNSTGDLIAVFDADMIPKNNFLQKTVPYFFDKNIGFVQTPQSFYNPDIFQRFFRKRIPSEQDFFMRDIQLKRSYINAEIHVGTNAVFRREALDAIGGYPVFSITEDIALGFLIQSIGYKSVFLNEPLAIGLNPTNLKDFLVQRDRWCRGNLQLLKGKNPFFIKGLKFNQRVAYLDGLFSWYSSVLKMIFILAPIFYLLTGIFFINAPLKDLLIVFLPYFISQYLLFSINSPNTRTMSWAHIYETILAPYNAKSCILNFFNIDSIKFNVTNKNVKETNSNNYLKQATPHILLILLTLIAWYNGFSSFLNGKLDFGVFIINLIWTIYNVYPMVLLILLASKNSSNDQIDALVTDCVCVHLSQENKSFVVQKVSDTTITLVQDNDRVLLNGESVTLSLYEHTIVGTVTKSTNGVAVIDIEVENLATHSYLELISIYSTYLKPYYDLDEVLKNNLHKDL